MAIDLKELQTLLKKASGTGSQKDLPPGTQAMLGAAQAAAKQPGQIAPPTNLPINGNDPTGDALAAEQEQKAIDDQMREKDQEIETLRKEKQSIEQKLSQEQIARQQSEATAQLEQERMRFQGEMQKGQEELARERSKMQAEQIQHQSVLDQQAAEQKAEIAEERAKQMSDFANQQAQRFVKTTEDAAKNIAKQRQDSYKQIDDYRTKSMEAIEAARPGVSPALESQMQGAIQAMNRAGKIKDRLRTIPKPGTPPGQVSEVSAIADSGEGVLDKVATPLVTERMIKRSDVTPQPGRTPSLRDQSIDLAHLEGRLKNYDYARDAGYYDQYGRINPKADPAAVKKRVDELRAADLRAADQAAYDTARAQQQRLAAAGVSNARYAVADDDDLRRKQTDWSSDSIAGAKKQGIEQLYDMMTGRVKKTSEIDRIQNMYRPRQPGRQATWVDTVGEAIAAPVNMVAQWLPEMQENWQRGVMLDEMAKARGVDRGWFSHGGDEAAQRSFEQSASNLGIENTGRWATAGRMVADTAEASLGLGSLGVPVTGGVASRAVGAVGSKFVGRGAARRNAYNIYKHRPPAMNARPVAGTPPKVVQPQTMQQRLVANSPAMAEANNAYATRMGQEAYNEVLSATQAQAAKNIAKSTGSTAYAGNAATDAAVGLLTGPTPMDQHTGISAAQPVRNQQQGAAMAYNPTQQQQQFQAQYQGAALPTMPKAANATTAPTTTSPATSQQQPQRLGSNLASFFNANYGDFDMTNPGRYGLLQGNLGKGIGFADKLIRAGTGGMLKILPDATMGYNTARRLDPAQFALNAANPQLDPRINREPAYNALARQIQEAYTQARTGNLGETAYNLPWQHRTY